MEIKANAKINLCLDVIRRREDGYHDLKMIMVPLQLHDVLQVEFACEDVLESDEDNMPCDERNTMIKAIQIMRAQYGVTQHFHIRIKKRIPMEAGLAGGSADAAAIIHAVDHLCELHLSMADKIAIGKQVGADVPFCIVNEPSVVGGIGEQVERFCFHCPFHILLVKPQQGVSTKEAYQTLDFHTCHHPDCEQVKAALQANDFQKLCHTIGNTLESSAFQLVPEVKALKQKLIDLGFEGVLMSGSGSTVFALTKDEALLEKAYQTLQSEYMFVEKTVILHQA